MTGYQKGGYQPTGPEEYMAASPVNAMRPDLNRQDTPASPLASDMQSLHKELVVLNESIRVLRNRLGPVMSQAEAEEAKLSHGKAFASSCEVGHSINEARMCAASSQEIVNDIFKYLQI